MEYPKPLKTKSIPVASQVIYDSLFRYFAKDNYQLANTYIYSWESDFFCQTKSGFSIEVEVKISRSDFFADFKKESKHSCLTNHKKAYVKGKYSNMVETCNYIPNRFYYAMPANLVKLEEIPDYAGVLWLEPYTNYFGEPDYRLKCIRKAPVLHDNKQDRKNQLLEKFYWQSFTLRSTIRDLKKQLKESKEQVKQLKKGNVIEFN